MNVKHPRCAASSSVSTSFDNFGVKKDSHDGSSDVSHGMRCNVCTDTVELVYVKKIAGVRAVRGDIFQGRGTGAQDQHNVMS